MSQFPLEVHHLETKIANLYSRFIYLLTYLFIYVFIAKKYLDPEMWGITLTAGVEGGRCPLAMHLYFVNVHNMDFSWSRMTGTYC